MMQKLFQSVVLLLGLFLGSYANASELNAANNPAMNPCIQRPELSGCGANGSAQIAPNKIIRIPSHYGAVAYDGTKGILGASENNLKSSRAAKKEAIQVCIKLGGTAKTCRIAVVSRNSCNAVALGANSKGGGVSAGDADLLKEVAENKVMQQCRDMGGQKCFIAYSYCSRDPRYQVGR